MRPTLPLTPRARGCYDAPAPVSTAVDDPRVRALVVSLVHPLPTEAILLDVSKERSLVSGSESIALIFYTVLLRHLGYAEDIDIAELEIEPLRADLGRQQNLDRIRVCFRKREGLAQAATIFIRHPAMNQADAHAARAQRALQIEEGVPEGAEHEQPLVRHRALLGHDVDQASQLVLPRLK